MLEQLQALHVDMDSTDIFLTHLHSDHCGLAPELIRANCQIFVSEADKSYLCAKDSQEDWKRIYQENLLEGFSPDELAHLWTDNPATEAAPIPYQDYVAVSHGQILHYGGVDLQCLETPCHTLGHMCLYYRQNQRFFSVDHVLFYITPTICSW